MNNDDFINNFINSFNIELKLGLSSGFLREEYFTTWDYNYQSEVHSRIMGLIVKICSNQNLNIEIERGLNYTFEGKNKRFRPDIIIYKGNEIFAIIEYESTNSSDSRFFDFNRPTSDLKFINYYLKSTNILKNSKTPKYWMIISTLPNNSVNSKNWGSWEFRKKDVQFQQLINSPYEFYIENYKKHTAEIVKNFDFKSTTKICLFNIDKNIIKNELEIDL